MLLNNFVSLFLFLLRDITTIERNKFLQYVLFEKLTLYIGDLENRLQFELQCWSTTNFEAFVELSALSRYLERFGGNNMV